MASIVRRLTTRTLTDALGRSTYVLVRLDRTPSFHEGLADFFDAAYPGLFTFGLLERAEVRAEVLTAMFQTAAGSLRRGVTDGYYLFGAGGKVIGTHGGQSRPAEFTDAGDPDEEALRVRVEKALGRRSPSVLEAVRQLAMYFVPIIERKQQVGGLTWNDPFLGRTGSTPPPAPRVAGPGGADAYALLELQPYATEEQVKAAYKAQLGLNHPDRVAHLSPALQQFARQQVLAVHAAYATIARVRGF